VFGVSFGPISSNRLFVLVHVEICEVIKWVRLPVSLPLNRNTFLSNVSSKTLFRKDSRKEHFIQAIETLRQ
jgi:hypothetical protein